MTAAPLHWQTIGQLSEQIHSGQLSPVELMEHLLDRVQSLDEQLHSFRLVSRERALAGAQAAELALKAGRDAGPLHGIPYAAKDIIDVQGLPTTAGSPLLEGTVSDTDATVVSRLNQAGMVVLGKTHTVQFALGAPGVNHDHGTPHNPWHPTHHVPGGSSSGSGVAVGAGLVPAALGTDTGGSVRIPAALCGTVGLKTTVGQVSRHGVFPLSWTLDSVGPLVRSVEDAALVYQAMRGPDPHDATTRDAPPQNVLDGLHDGVRGLRVAVVENVFWDDTDPEVSRAVRACADVFANLGAHVESLQLPEVSASQEANQSGIISATEACFSHLQRLGERFEEYDPVVSSRVLPAKEFSAVEYLRCLNACNTLQAGIARVLRDIDVFLAPTSMIPAAPLAEVDASMDAYVPFNLRYSRNTRVANVLGLCALTVPCGFSSEGLPIGLMIHGKPRDEAMVLRAGQAFEQATDWHTRTPELNWAEK